MKKLLLSLLLLAHPLFACEFKHRVEPPRPTDLDDISIDFRGRCPDACVPHDATVDVFGGGITITFSPRGDGCILIPVDWSKRVDLGRLPAGRYGVQVRFRGELVSDFPLVVDSAFSIAPAFGPAGTRVMIQGLDLDACTAAACTPVVFFGNVPADAVTVVGGTILATVPAHAEGPVDVTVETFAGESHTTRNAFRYGPRNAADVGEWARVLFPLHYEGPGALGARWNTRITVRNDAPVDVWSLPALKDPLLRPSERALFPTEARDGGAFLYVPRGLDDHVKYASRIFDASKTQSTIGTEVPVVRAEDTSSVIELLDVRVGEGYRALLRVYDFDTVVRTVNVSITRPDGTTITRTATLTGGITCLVEPCLQPAPTFAAVDLSAIPEVQSETGVDVTITADTNEARLWAFVSVTNNETQQVTLWTPQHASITPTTP